MKLSQKLLGLAGLAMADYACCPYDDYGMPEANCVGVLTEKTPFADGEFQRNDCKAWETNVDATYEGNSRSSGCADYNWGSCGFQRHFPWRQWSTDEKTKLSLGSTHQFTFDGSVTSPALTFTSGTATSTTAYNVGADPFLGGMCKLFVPAAAADIVQVQVAGVHKPAGLAQFPAQAQTDGAGTALTGTVYCFGVANIAETADNTNNIMNGNVAGEGNADVNGRVDPFASMNSLNRQAGLAYSLNFGDAITDAAATQAGMIKNGANFDVVAHFTDSFCEGKFGNAAAVVEMQLLGDENVGDANYPINQASGFSHAHNDVLDKRHTTTGYGGYYISSSTDATYLAPSSAPTEMYKWPNAGAWAAYYSSVICAKDGTAGAAAAQQNLWTNVARQAVMSVSAGDYRVNDDGQTDCTVANVADLKFRFNLRQLGNDISTCGPGTLPDTETNTRCTWNWNHVANAAYGATNADDPEGFFDRSDQMVVDTWNRRRRDAVLRNTQLGGSSAVTTQNVIMTLTFRDNAGTAITPVSVTPDVGHATASGSVVTVACTQGAIPSGGNQRDAFPVCFQGDEVHVEMVYEPSDVTSHTTLVNNWWSTVVTTFS